MLQIKLRHSRKALATQLVTLQKEIVVVLIAPATTPKKCCSSLSLEKHRNEDYLKAAWGHQAAEPKGVDNQSEINQLLCYHRV